MAGQRRSSMLLVADVGFLGCCRGFGFMVSRWPWISLPAGFGFLKATKSMVGQ